MLRQRDLGGCVAELHRFAAPCDDDLFFRHTELLCRLRRNRRADDGRTGLSGDRTDIRNMIEMRVRYEDRFGLDHVRRGEAGVVGPRRAVEVGVEQIDLAPVGEFEIGIAEPTNDDGVGLRWRRRAAGHGGLVAVTGLRDIGAERCARQGQETGTRKCRQPYRFHHFILSLQPMPTDMGGILIRCNSASAQNEPRAPAASGTARTQGSRPVSQALICKPRYLE